MTPGQIWTRSSQGQQEALLDFSENSKVEMKLLNTRIQTKNHRLKLIIKTNQSTQLTITSPFVTGKQIKTAFGSRARRDNRPTNLFAQTFPHREFNY